MLNDFMLVHVRRPVQRAEQDFPEDMNTINHRWRRVTLTGNERLTEMCDPVKITNHIQLSGVLLGWGFSNSPGGQKPLRALRLIDLSLIMETSLENCQYPFILKKELNLERSCLCCQLCGQGWTGSLPTQHHICHYSTYTHAITHTADHKGGLHDFAH